MEKATVIFRNPDTEKEIICNFTYEDKNHQFTTTNNHDELDPMDLAGFLAITFLNNLNDSK